MTTPVKLGICKSRAHFFEKKKKNNIKFFTRWTAAE